MSSRQLRKLQKQKELEDLQAHASEDEGSESEDGAPVQKPKASMFAGFATLGDDDQDDDDEPDEPGEEPQANEPERIETPKFSSKKSKKKKKKGKKAAAAETPSIDDVKDGPKKPAGNVDEIDRAIQELNLAAKASATSTTQAEEPMTKTYERICELLSINTYHLKVMNEMRNLFGREAIAAAQSEEAHDEQNRNRRRGNQLQQNVDLETFLKGTPGKSLPEVTLRRNPFLSGKETWPQAPTEGLTMKVVKDGSTDIQCGAVEFSFAHDKTYNKLESSFFGLVQMHDPMQLVWFLRRHPYHVSSLIQVSKVAKQDQNSALSADLCERALFTFGRVSISTFRQKLEVGKARLNFNRPENRQFWLAGYHYLKSLNMKGTYRTALEWAKLLFAMNLSDPYGIIHFLHVLAIRAHESKWFIDFCDSGALDKCDTHQDYIRQTLVLAHLQLKDAATAKAVAVEGMQKLPWLYCSIFKALNLDAPKPVWGKEPKNPHDVLFTELYLHQTKALWDNSPAIGLLKEAAYSLQKALNSASPPPTSDASLRFVGRNTGRFVYLDNTPALMALVPNGMLHSFPNWDFDPLPPKKEDNIFSYDSQKRQWEQDRGDDMANLNPGFDLGGMPRGAIERVLQRAVRNGAPPEIRQALQDLAVGRALDADEDEDPLDARGMAAGDEPPTGLWQAFLDLLWPVRVLEGDDDGVGHPDPLGLFTGPGGWPSDEEEEEEEYESDGDMPALIYEHQIDRDGRIDDSDDEELPPLEPAESGNGNGNMDNSDDEIPSLERPTGP